MTNYYKSVAISTCLRRNQYLLPATQCAYAWNLPNCFRRFRSKTKLMILNRFTSLIFCIPSTAFSTNVSIIIKESEINTSLTLSAIYVEESDQMWALYGLASFFREKQLYECFLMLSFALTSNPVHLVPICHQER